ncbi:MAG TPA: hypothetical protein VI583_07600, partial [Cyclobacteriaceae bacterium]|nr:hypothetical protein [Cyclobacteriaceae bacterium]
MNTNRIKIPVNLNALAGIILITALILAFMRIYKEQGINSRESAYPEEKGSASIFEQPHDNPGKFKEYFRTILARRGESSSGYTAG